MSRVQNISVNGKALVPEKMVLVLLSLMLIGSVFFYKERCLFIDTPHGLFRMINDNAFQVGDSRYGGYLSQLLPYAAFHLHLPLWTVLVLFSASAYLLFILVVVLLIYKYENYALAVLFGLYATLFVSDTFYYPPSEGIALLLFAFGTVLYMARKKRPFLIILPVFFLAFYFAIWTHPLVMLAAIYLWFFFWLRHTDWPFAPWQSAICTVVLLFLCYRKYYIGVHHGYDSTRLENVAGISWQKIISVFSSGHFHFFMRSCLTNYWPAALLFIVGLWELVRKRKYIMFLFSFGFVALYVSLLCISYPDADAQHRFYFEFEYMPLAIICAAPFVYYVLPLLHPRIVVIVLALIFSIRLGYICRSANYFINRVVLLTHINEKMKEKNLTKILIPDGEQAVSAALKMTWATPEESIMLSALGNEEPQRTFVFMQPDQGMNYTNGNKNVFIGCWDLRSATKLNSYYFCIDTTVPYTSISYSELMK